MRNVSHMLQKDCRIGTTNTTLIVQVNTESTIGEQKITTDNIIMISFETTAGSTCDKILR